MFYTITVHYRPSDSTRVLYTWVVPKINGDKMSFWPEGYQACFNLSFDYDSNSALMWRAPLDIVAQSRGRFAPNVAIDRILDLLDKYEIKATFFTPGWTIDQFPESCEEIISRGHEMGAHGYLHERLAEISMESERSVFEKSMTSFKKLGIKPEGFRAPYWLISDRTLGLIQELGFRYDSNFMDNDMPYMLKWRGEETNLVELPVEWLMDDWPHFDTNRMSIKQVWDIWKPEWDGIYELGRYFGLTCHPQCIGRISRLNMLEKLLIDAKEKGDVWFANCKEVADWTRKKMG
jgi:peptidoglycan/xylan/chitin deacetylase (PgdA/CDA1 family)